MNCSRIAARPVKVTHRSGASQYTLTERAHVPRLPPQGGNEERLVPPGLEDVLSQLTLDHEEVVEDRRERG